MFNSYQRKWKYAVCRIYVKILVTLANNDVIKTNISQIAQIRYKCFKKHHIVQGAISKVNKKKL